MGCHPVAVHIYTQTIGGTMILISYLLFAKLVSYEGIKEFCQMEYLCTAWKLIILKYSWHGFVNITCS